MAWRCQWPARIVGKATDCRWPCDDVGTSFDHRLTQAIGTQDWLPVVHAVMRCDVPTCCVCLCVCAGLAGCLFWRLRSQRACCRATSSLQKNSVSPSRSYPGEQHQTRSRHDTENQQRQQKGIVVLRVLSQPNPCNLGSPSSLLALIVLPCYPPPPPPSLPRRWRDVITAIETVKLVGVTGASVTRWW